ncbi:MAG: CapA family protein, partial [Thermanaerothrix sp.]|uniref:CapA family protein n=1 Tax=Thermanaerothrix sp. TaxID=2972675 RepID=UPI003C7A6EA0
MQFRRKFFPSRRMVYRGFAFGLLSLALLVACQNPAGAALAGLPQNLPPTVTPFQPLPTTSPVPTATSHPAPTLWLDPALPPDLRSQVRLPPGWDLAPTAEMATLRLALSAPQDAQGYWVYALVGRFPTLEDEVSAEWLRQVWQGAQPVSLWMDEATLAALSAAWGAPAPGVVQTVAADELVETLWAHPEARGIVPFERLEPRLKVVAVEGQSPLHKDFNPARYPLALPFALQGDAAALGAFQSAAQAAGVTAFLPTGNRDPAKLTVVAVTGVTAIVRATAWTLDVRGIDYAIQEIAPWLREADITHINNEVAFRENCPHANDGLNAQGVIVFPCSDSRYLAVLEALGTDVVEMTGDHFIDARPEDVLYTLDQYHQRGW